MINASVQDGINNQIRIELHSAYVYLGMSAWFDRQSLPGAAGWMRHQANEEVAHAMRLFGFLNDRDGVVALQAIDAPAGEYDSPLAAFQTALDHERHVTESIHNLYALAVEHKDFATQSHLQWFIDEQVEEEQQAQEIVDLLKRAGKDGPSLLLIDQQLSQRGASE